MSLNPENISFLLGNIRNAQLPTFIGFVNQLFSYLNDEIKDNPVFEKYDDDEIYGWDQWIGVADKFGHWELPSSLESCKSLAYTLYKLAANKGKDWFDSLALTLFHQQGYIHNLRAFNETFLGYLEKALNDIIAANPEIEETMPKKINESTVFIVHGHDKSLKQEVQLLLNRAGVNCIVLHEQTDKGRTVIDKLIQESGVAGYGIALLTPDDLTVDGNTRARQNVILEIGYFLGKLGKERIRMIVKGDIEIPSDLQGILYSKYDVDGAWKIKLLKEIQSVGIYADIQAVVNQF